MGSLAGGIYFRARKLPYFYDIWPAFVNLNLVTMKPLNPVYYKMHDLRISLIHYSKETNGGDVNFCKVSGVWNIT